MRIPHTFIEEIQQKIDIVDVVQEYVTLQRKGARYWGLSPFKQEKTPSFSVDREKGLYYCFSTQQGGTVFNFLMAMEGMSFPEAVRTLSKRVGVDIPHSPGKEEDHGYELELLQRITKSFHFILRESAHAVRAREYLATRNISHENIEKFQLGYAPEDPRWLVSFLKKHRYSEDTVRKAGLLSRAGSSAFFRNRVIFPITDSYGNTVGFGARVLGQGDVKYLNSRESALFQKGKLLFGFPQAKEAIRKEKLVYLVEGYFDVLALHAIGVEHVLAPLGTAITEAQLHFLQRRTSKVVLVFDGDEAGEDAAFRVGKLTERLEIPTESVFLPSGKDPSDFVEAQKGEELGHLLQHPQPLFSQLVQIHKKHGNMQDPEKRLLVSHRFFEYIREVPLQTRQDRYLEYLADEFLLNRLALATDFRRSIALNMSPKMKSPRVKTREISIDMSLIATSLRNVKFFELLREQIQAEDFLDLQAQELYYQMEQTYREIFAKKEVLSEHFTERVLSRIEDEECRNLLIGQQALAQEVPTEAFKTGIRVMQERMLRKRQKETEQEIRNMERISSRKEEYRGLIKAKQDIDRKIDELQHTS